MQAGVPASWVAGDEVYGADPRLRALIRGHRLGYVLQVSANRRLPTHAGPIRVDQLAALLPDKAWQHRSAGAGSKGPRVYSWAWISLTPETRPGEQAGGEHHALIRRNDTTGELAYHRCWSPTPVPLATLVAVAGQRWRIEESFQAAKGLVGLDQHQSPASDLLATLDRAGHARPRLPRRDHRHRTRPPPGAGRADRGHRR